MFPDSNFSNEVQGVAKNITLAFSIYNSVEVNPVSISIYLNSDAPYQTSN